MSVAVIGGGSWGTALAIHLARAGSPVRLWAREREVVDGIRARRRSPWYLADVDVPAALVWLLVTVSFRYVSLGSILAAGCVPLGALLLGAPTPYVLAAFAIGAIVVARHHANIARLFAGLEPKLGQRRSA